VCGRLVTTIVLFVQLNRLCTFGNDYCDLVQLTVVWTFGNGNCAVRAFDWCVDVW